MTSAIVENQDRRCEVCGKYASVSGLTMTTHHIIWRSRGGTDGPTITVDNLCHDLLNGEKSGGQAWDVTEYTENHIVVTDRQTGEVKVDRWHDDSFDEGLLVAEFYNAPQGIMERIPLFKFLSDDGIKAVGEALTKLDAARWVARGVLATIAQLHSPYGERVDVLNALAGDSGVSLSTVYREARAIEAAEKLGLELSNLQNWTPEAVRLAAEQADTERAIAIHEELASQGVAGKRGAFREALVSEGMTEKPSEIPYHACPTCGQTHRVKE